MAQKVQVLIIYKGLAKNAPYFYIIAKESKNAFRFFKKQPILHENSDILSLWTRKSKAKS